MTKTCRNCGRPKGPPDHFAGICDQVRLSNGHLVHRSRIEIGGDLHEQLHEHGLKVTERNITPEMREQMRKGSVRR